MKRMITVWFVFFVALSAIGLFVSGCSKSNPAGPSSGTVTGTITGTVTDVSTGNPIDSASVILGSSYTTTNSKGSYSFSKAPTGADTVTVIASGFVSQTKAVKVSSSGSEILNFSMQPTTTSLSGTVTDSVTNTPIAGATVTIGSQSTTTSSAGSYSFSGISAGSYTIAVSANGYVSSTKKIQISAGQPQIVNFSLQPTGTTVSGTITDATTNKPIPSAIVKLGQSTVTTSAQGGYSFPNMSPGSYTISASAANYVSQSKQIQVSAGQPQTVNFSLQPSTTTVSGTITDSTTNTTIAGATVTLDSLSTTTSSAGSYSFSGVSAGSYTLSVSASGYNSASKQVQVEAGVPQTVDLSLKAMQESVRLSGTLNSAYYQWTPFNFDSYQFVRSANGIVDHNVKVTIKINPTVNPVTIIVMRPDGYYKFEVDSTTAGFNKTFESNASGDWEVIVWNYGNAQTSYSGTVTMDFSDYPVSTNDISSQVAAPIDTAIAANSTASQLRFLKAGMSFQLNLKVSGTVYASVAGPGPSYAVVLNSQKVDSTYSSQTFTATSTGFYSLSFQNQNILFSKTVTGSLLIKRGTSSGSQFEGEGKILR